MREGASDGAERGATVGAERGTPGDTGAGKPSRLVVDGAAGSSWAEGEVEVTELAVGPGAAGTTGDGSGVVLLTDGKIAVALDCDRVMAR